MKLFDKLVVPSAKRRERPLRPRELAAKGDVVVAERGNFCDESGNVRAIGVGQSDSGFYYNDRVNGICSSSWVTGSGAGNSFNEERRWDSTTYNFFHAYGHWP